MAKTQAKSAHESESAIKLAGETLTLGMRQINDYVRDPANADLGSDSADALARLMTKVAQVSGELRKAEAAARSADGDITPAQMLERIRRMSAAERTQFLRAATHADADQGKSGLA
jgi:hypothetical protein